MSGFIFIPLKKTHEVDLIKPFTTYINTVYETKEDDKAEASCARFSFDSPCLSSHFAIFSAENDLKSILN